MQNINVNVEKLTEKIQKLKDLKSECESIDVNPEIQVGSGESIEMVKAVDLEYVEIKTVIVTLLENSIQFFDNVKKSVIEADEEVAKKLN